MSTGSLLMWNYRSNQDSNTVCRAFTHSWIDHLIFCPRPSYLITLLRHSSFETNAPSILARLCRKVPNHHQNTWIRLVRIYLASGTMNYQFTYGGTDNLSLQMKGAKQWSWCDWSDVSAKTSQWRRKIVLRSWWLSPWRCSDDVRSPKHYLVHENETNAEIVGNGWP